MADDSSFFCSELVAAAYQAMGILTRKVAASTFLPVDFDSLPLSESFDPHKHSEGGGGGQGESLQELQQVRLYHLQQARLGEVLVIPQHHSEGAT